MGHGKESIGGLVELGRRFSAVNFVTFALAAGDLLASRVSRLALEVQTAASGAAGVRRQWRRCLEGLQADEVALQSLSVWCFLAATVGALVPRGCWRNLWRALRISPLGRAFPKLVASLDDML